MISFIIITYNSEKVISSCLDSICSVRDIPREIIVVDNNSVDSTTLKVSKYPEVRLIRAEVNRGYSWAVNKGVSAANGEIYFILNPDTRIVGKNMAAAYNDIILSNGDILGPRVLNPGKTRQFSARRFPTLINGIFNRSSVFTSLIPSNKYSVGYLNPIVDESEKQNVDWVSGCAMIVKRDTFRKVGGFDESYFLFYEDIDFCYRAKKAGINTIYFPSIDILHDMGISITVPNLKINYERHRGMWVYYSKHFKRTKKLDLLVIVGIIGRFFITSLKVALKKFHRDRSHAR